MSVHIGLNYRPGKSFEFRCLATGVYQASMVPSSGDMALLQRALAAPPDTRTIWQRLAGAPVPPRKPEVQS